MRKFNFKLEKSKNFFYFIIIAFSISISIYYGYRGIFPIDSFLIFDAGYKIQNKFYPFQDYWSITGPLLDYVQFILFEIFGVNWFSYVLHSALVNCLLSTFSFYFFINLGIDRKISFLSSICIAILAYPSTGTPFVDHHGVIFSVISLMFLILGLKKQKKIYYFLSSNFLVFSFFSKQIPSAYLGVLFFVTTLFFCLLVKQKKFLFYFIYGGLSGLGLFLVIFFFQGIELNNIFIQYILYPMSIGSNRISSFNFDLKNVFFQFKFIYLSIFPLFFLVIYLVSYKKKNQFIFLNILTLFCIFLSFCVFIYSQIITKNQILIFFLIPFFLALSIYFITPFFKKKNFLINLIILLMLFTTVKYHLRFNENKKFMELVNADFRNAVNAEVLDKKLSGLQWITPYYLNNPDYELKMLRKVKNDIILDNSNKIIITDYQILPAITNTKFLAPNKWFDNLSVPQINNKFFFIYKRFFLSKLKEQNIQTIYLVGKEKLYFLEIILDKKNCLNTTNINEIAIKLNISNCY